MMDVIELYNKLYHDSVAKIRDDSYQIDPMIDSANDRRFGITLLFRPDDRVKDAIGGFLSAIRSVDPHQYYYRDSDLHVTVMSIISCYEGFGLHQFVADGYVKAIKKALTGISPFTIDFRGLTASPSCLMVQGFVESTVLEQIRERVKGEIKRSGLEESIDKRYTIKTAHSTIVRLKEKLRDKEGFLAVVENYRDFHFGACNVTAIEMVFNDWYHRKENVKTLSLFELR